MAWIRTDYGFDAPCVCFVLPLRAAAVEASEIMAVLEREQPDEIEKAVYDLIVKHRPELAGGVVCVLQFRADQFAWHIIYQHPSLPRCAIMDAPVRLPLIPVAEPLVVEGGDGVSDA